MAKITNKMIVKLPHMRSRRSSNIQTKEIEAPKRKDDTAVERMRRYRQKLKEDPDRMKAQKKRKQMQNAKYKKSVSLKRKHIPTFDEQQKQKQKKWKARSRKNKKKAELAEQAEDEAASTAKDKAILRRKKAAVLRAEVSRLRRTNALLKNGSQTEDTETEEAPDSTMTPERATTRKRAERARQSLPESSKDWGVTVAHLVDQSTPTRRSEFMNHCAAKSQDLEGTHTSSLDTIAETFSPQTSGRPTKKASSIRVALFESVPALSDQKSKVTKRFLKRQKLSLSRISKPDQKKKAWEEKIRSFFERDDISRVMPNKRDVIVVGGVSFAKRHLIQTKQQTYNLFKQEQPDYPQKYTTFIRTMPRHIRRMKLSDKRICVCLKDYNLEKKIEALNKVTQQLQMPDLKSTLRQLSNESVCQYKDVRMFPSRKCVDRACEDCGGKLVQSKYEPLIEAAAENPAKVTQPKWYTWEKVDDSYINKKGTKIDQKSWQQVAQQDSVAGLVDRVVKDVEAFTGHQFRADYQQHQESQLQSDRNLPLDHATVRVDFSENFAIQYQDEIESAHWTQKQVTIHPAFLIRHAPDSTPEKPHLRKESLIYMSDDLGHDATAVYAFMSHLIVYIKNNPGPTPIRVLHRFSDNAACQYKCRDSFSHLKLYQEIHEVDVRYHFCEPGHGKGPSDGLGATMKQKLTSLIMSDKAVIHNAYDAYLCGKQALSGIACDDTRPSRKRQFDSSHREVFYLPRKRIRSDQPVRTTNKSLKGTQKMRSLQLLEGNIAVCADLSCICPVCLLVEEGPCYFGQFRETPKVYHLDTGKEYEETTLQREHQLREKSVDRSQVQAKRKNRQDAPLRSPVAPETPLMIEREKYCAVYYSKPLNYYIGRVLRDTCDCDTITGPHLKVKFLQARPNNQFIWPRREDTQCVDQKYVFSGPLTLEGHGPFEIVEIDNVRKQFKMINKL